jgi:5'-nucleotidase (lipoprotein e(P4) family)
VTRRAAAIAWLLTVPGAASCASHHPVATPVPQPVAAVRNDVRWFRASAEYRGLAIEVYRTATAQLPVLTRGLAAGTWAVILDADETVLDNSRHERQLADRNESFSEAEWSQWVRARAATAIPGAVEFTRQVHELGGRVAIVTNRADSLCNPTRENLQSVGVRADVVLCQVAKESDKNPRFERVEGGTADPKLPPLKVVEWIGDNIQDFPRLTQAIRDTPSMYADFGLRYFLLPNPMYGSWTRNAEP